jgi:HlyD family secretion protein
MKRLLGITAAAALMGCSGRTPPDFIGSAIVEAQTYQVAASVQGKIAALYKQEGQQVGAGELLAVIDTVPLILQRRELEAGMSELASAIRSKEKEIKAARAEASGLEKDWSRVSPLVKEGSLPPQQGDKLSSALDAARLKLSAAQDMLESLRGKEAGLQAKADQIKETIRRCYLASPAPGRVLTRYKNLEEVAAPGQPVFQVGRDDTLQVDFFVPQTGLAALKYGQQVELRLDNGEDAAWVSGNVSWIGSEAEFSPRNIQTRESRNELVFRVRALAANKDGMLKRGLPVEVWKARPQ